MKTLTIHPRTELLCARASLSDSRDSESAHSSASAGETRRATEAGGCECLNSH